MSQSTNHYLSIACFAAAATIAISLNGAVLMGFDHLAAAPQARTASQLVKTDAAPKQVTLPRVVITARRA